MSNDDEIQTVFEKLGHKPSLPKMARERATTDAELWFAQQVHEIADKTQIKPVVTHSTDNTISLFDAHEAAKQYVDEIEAIEDSVDFEPGYTEPLNDARREAVILLNGLYEILDAIRL